MNLIDYIEIHILETIIEIAMNLFIRGVCNMQFDAFLIRYIYIYKMYVEVNSYNY